MVEGSDPVGGWARISVMLMQTMRKLDHGLPGATAYAAGEKGFEKVLRVKETWSAEMAAVQAGDRAAYAALFRHFAPRVKAFLMKSGTPAALAEEVAQDVMATLWQKSAQFDPAKASVATWVFTIARNRVIDLSRRDRRVEPKALEVETEPDQADVYAAAEESRRLVEALGELPEKQRSLIQRAFWGELSHSELAQETGLPLGTIKSRIRLALDRLRARLNEG